MYRLVPIEKKDMNEFFELQIQYLVQDEIASSQEDIEYFSDENGYRQIIRDLMDMPSPIEPFWIYRKNIRVGATHYRINPLKDGECFILDFWVFPSFRNQGYGKKAFQYLESYASLHGAQYFRLNSSKEASVRFWKRLGFVYEGLDEDEMELYIKRS